MSTQPVNQEPTSSTNEGWPSTKTLCAGKVQFNPRSGGKANVTSTPSGWSLSEGGNAPVYNCTAGSFKIKASPMPAQDDDSGGGGSSNDTSLQISSG